MNGVERSIARISQANSALSLYQLLSDAMEEIVVIRTRMEALEAVDYQTRLNHHEWSLGSGCKGCGYVYLAVMLNGVNKEEQEYDYLELYSDLFGLVKDCELVTP